MTTHNYRHLPLLLPLLFCAVALLVCTASAAVYHKSLNRAKYRISLITRNIQPAFLRKRVQRTADTLISSLSSSRRGKRGCPVSVCFAFDGSSSVSPSVYGRQKEVAYLIASVLSADTKVTFSAVQYTRTTSAIASNTVNYWGFWGKVARSRRKGGQSANLGSGLGYCGFQVRRDRKKKGVVIVIGSGKSNAGFNAAFVARAIERSGKVVAVSTSGNKFMYKKSLDTNARDVVSMQSAYQYDSGLRQIVAAICK